MAGGLRAGVAAIASLTISIGSTSTALAEGDPRTVPFPTAGSVVLPPEKDLCKDDFWRGLVTGERSPFENQGHCVSHATHGDSLVAPGLANLNGWTLLPEPPDAKVCTALPSGPCVVTYEGLQIPLDYKTEGLASPRDPPEPRLSVSGELLQTRSVSVDSTPCFFGSPTFSYTVAGRATGPYSGSFVQRGIVTLASRSGRGEQPPVAQHDATLTIDSPTGTVTADYTNRWPTASGVCVMARGVTAVRFGGDFQFEATITAPDGTSFTERGVSRMLLSVIDFPAAVGLRELSFESDMVGRLPTGSSLGLPTPPCPPEGCR